MKPLSFLIAALLYRNSVQTTDLISDATEKLCGGFGSSRGGTWGGLLLGVAIAPVAVTAVSTVPAYGAELTQWSFDPETRQLEVRVPGGTTPNYFLLAQPARIVLDLPNTVVGNVVEEQRYSGVVRHIRVGQFQPGLTRIVIELSSDVVLSPAQVELRNIGSIGNGRAERWVVRPLLAGDTPVVATTVEPVPQTPAPEGVDEPTEPEGVVLEPSFEPSTEAESETTEESEEMAIAPQDPVSSAESVSESRIDSSNTTSEGEVETSELPPLEPGAFEIPVVIPPPEVEDTINEPELEALEVETEVALEPEEFEAAPEVESEVEPDESSDSTTRTTRQIEVSSPEELQQALDEIMARGEDAQIVQRTPTTPEQSENTADENDGNGTTDLTELEAADSVLDESSSEEVASASVPPSLSRSTSFDSEGADALESSRSTALDEADLDETSLNESDLDEADERVPDSVDRVVRTPSELNFPTPENARAIATAPSLEPEMFQDLPPATLDVDESVTVTVPTLEEAEIQSPAVNDLQEETDAEEASSDETDSDETDTDVNDLNREDDTTANDTEADPENEIATAPASELSDSEISSTPVSSGTTVMSLPPPESALPSQSVPSQSVPSQSVPSGNTAAPPSPSTVEDDPVRVPIQRDRQLILASRSGTQIPSGTVLTLRYPRLTSTLLQTGMAWQDVLLLEQTIRDSSGRVIAPEGSQIIGRFEITDRQVRFVTQAIALDGRNIPLQAVSSWVAIGDNADAVLIRPNQIVNVRLAENFSR